jgi:hypothetical protein
MLTCAVLGNASEGAGSHVLHQREVGRERLIAATLSATPMILRDICPSTGRRHGTTGDILVIVHGLGIWLSHWGSHGSRRAYVESQVEGLAGRGEKVGGRRGVGKPLRYNGRSNRVTRRRWVGRSWFGVAVTANRQTNVRRRARGSNCWSLGGRGGSSLGTQARGVAVSEARVRWRRPGVVRTEKRGRKISAAPGWRWWWTVDAAVMLANRTLNFSKHRSRLCPRLPRKKLGPVRLLSQKARRSGN